MFGLGLIGAIVSAIIFTYAYNLEKDKCKCSKNWRRDYIKIYTGVIFVLSVIIFILNISGLLRLENVPFGLAKIGKIFPIILGLSMIISSFTYTYALFTYAQELVHKKCKCSDNWQRTFIYYYSMFVASLMVLGIISVVILIIRAKSQENESLAFVTGYKEAMKNRNK